MASIRKEGVAKSDLRRRPLNWLITGTERNARRQIALDCLRSAVAQVGSARIEVGVTQQYERGGVFRGSEGFPDLAERFALIRRQRILRCNNTFQVPLRNRPDV